MAKRKGSPVSRESASSKREREGMDESEGMVDHDAREVENAKRLDKLPQEVWEKITDNLENDDLFPLALSCRYFRQKQKELVARTRQSGSESGKPRRALKTNLKRKLEEGKSASAEYLSFCGKVRVSHPRDGFFRQGRIKSLAAFHGHLPLLKKLSKYESHTPAEDAGESSSSQSLLLFVALASDFFLVFSSSQRARPTGDLAMAENPEGVQDECGSLSCCS